MPVICRQCRLVQDDGGVCAHCAGTELSPGWRPLLASVVTGVELVTLGHRRKVVRYLHAGFVILIAPIIGAALGSVIAMFVAWFIGVMSLVIRPALTRGDRLRAGRPLLPPPAHVHTGALVPLRGREAVTTMALLAADGPLLRRIAAEPFVLLGEGGPQLVTGSMWFEPDEDAAYDPTAFGFPDLPLPPNARFRRGVLRDGDQLAITGPSVDEMTSVHGYREAVRRVLRGVPGRPLMIGRIGSARK